MSQEIQAGLVQIDEYGPWTVSPEPRRETDLQSLQASLFGEFAALVGEHDGYAFYGRFDNMYAVTNEATPQDYRRFQRRVRNRYPVTVSVGVGAAATPVAALGVASDRLQAAGGAQDQERRGALAAGDGATVDTGPVTVAHFDVVDVTGTQTDRRNAVDVTLSMRRATLELATHLRSEHGGLAHFVGGDNVIAVCPDLDPAAYKTAIDHVADETGIELQVGIGRGPTAHAAGAEAKHALERCRETGTRIRGTDRAAVDD
jgi:GTP cyclohydrolase IIa